MGIKPLKKFGQNYLIDKNIVNKMISALDLNRNDSALEIGPGKGFITRELYKHTKKLAGIEIDTRVIENLTNEFTKMKLFNTDFIKFDFKLLNDYLPIKVIGNIPFNLTGDILFKLIDVKEYIREAVLILPHDIALRLTAKKRTKEYGILTVVFNYFAIPKVVQKVSSNVFFPKPNLDAAIVHLNFNKEELPGINKYVFIKVVKAAFGNRRKTINNSLKNSIFRDYNFSNLNLSLSKRAEEFETADFLELTKYIQNQK